MTTIHLSLISHTNVGKTTLTRTLLQRDVGEVRDAPHVTEFSEGHTLITTAQGDQLQLWDTPGFGDSARLARRMRQSTQPLVWLFTQAWDRFTDRPFWGSQQALKHVREQTDLVLYLVNAGEAPQTQAHVASEMELLGWLGKPVLVLLNQMGQARSEAAEQADLQTCSPGRRSRRCCRWMPLRAAGCRNSACGRPCRPPCQRPSRRAWRA
jgi:predicted GTPase